VKQHAMPQFDLFIRSAVLKREQVDQWGSYPFCLPVVRTLDKLDFRSRVTFLVGENGTGKSTLLEAIAVNYGFNPEGGSKNFNFSTYETHSPLGDFLTLWKGPYRAEDGFFLRAESFYNVASEVDRLALWESYGGSLHRQSHGESFMSLLMNRFRGKGIYLLDEPEAALSPMRQLAMMARMRDLVEDGSQFIIATHSPILLGYPGADILVLGEDGPVLTPYEETEHYTLTRAFLQHPQRILDELFRE
jgi:predicted ATPase